jgi:hypothetical protein
MHIRLETQETPLSWDEPEGLGARWTDQPEANAGDELTNQATKTPTSALHRSITSYEPQSRIKVALVTICLKPR